MMKGAGARRDGCLDALDRARKRAHQAALTVEAAIQAQQEATNLVAKYEAELREIEMEITSQNGTATGQNSVAQLEAGLRKVINEMSSSQLIGQAEVQQVLAQMSALFQQVSLISTRCLQQSAAPMPQQQVPSQPSPLQQAP